MTEQNWPLSFNSETINKMLAAALRREFSMADLLYGGGGTPELLGRIVLQVWMDKSGRWIRFVTDGMELCYRLEGDCCSESWVYAITGMQYLIGATIMSIDGVYGFDLPDDGKSRQEFDKIYWIKYVTTKGNVDLEFRNSSNGFYGGWISRQDSIPGNVEMVAITGDYIA
jgi:hypothetical protein